MSQVDKPPLLWQDGGVLRIGDQGGRVQSSMRALVNDVEQGCNEPAC